MGKPTYVEVEKLPDALARHLPIKRGDVAVHAAERASMANPHSGQGRRCATVLVNLDTGESTGRQGSWGGANRFNPTNSVDLDSELRPLPENGAVVYAYEGAARGGSIIVHPTRLAKILPHPAVQALSEAALMMLGVYKTLNSRGRREWLDRNRSRVPSIAQLEALQAELVAAGCIKRSQSGAVTVTATGRNVDIPKTVFSPWS